jgi:hypothetical protein
VEEARVIRFDGRIAGEARTEEGAWPSIVAALNGVIPPYPGPSIVPSVTVPPPPKLDAAAPLPERARVVAFAYKGAVEKRFGKPCWAFRYGQSVERSKHYTDLCLCADALTEAKIAPAAWCAFSTDVWKKYAFGQRGKLPPVTWVCSSDRIEDRMTWFLAELPRYDGGQMWLGDVHRDLLNRWWRMRREIQQVAVRDGSLARAREVVARHFPRGQWDVLVERARVEATKVKQMLEHEVKRGGFLW